MIDPPVRVSSEPYGKYAKSEDVVKSRSWVQEFVDQGLMTREKILQRLTDQVKQEFSLRQELFGVQQSFDALKDPITNDISKAQFVDTISKRFGSQGPALKPGIMILYDMMRRHATYPFWTELPDELCEDAFIRVLALLRSEPYSQIHSSGCSTGSWGGHVGMLVTYREKTEQDHKRRLFRGMAEQTDEGTATPIQIVVPRFIYNEDLPHITSLMLEGNGTPLEEAMNTQRHVLVVEQEDERSVELLDILSKTEPGKCRKVRSPLRESYSIVVPTLLDIQKLPHLSQMGLQRTALRALITFLIAADSVHRGSVEWATTTDELSLNNGTNADMMNTVGHGTTHLQWMDIDSAAPDSFVQIFPLMSRLTDMFIKPSVW